MFLRFGVRARPAGSLTSEFTGAARLHRAASGGMSGVAMLKATHAAEGRLNAFG